jgi:hypothetical protein
MLKSHFFQHSFFVPFRLETDGNLDFKAYVSSSWAAVVLPTEVASTRIRQDRSD